MGRHPNGNPLPVSIVLVGRKDRPSRRSYSWVRDISNGWIERPDEKPIDNHMASRKKSKRIRTEAISRPK